MKINRLSVALLVTLVMALTSSLALAQTVNVNTAGAEELQVLPGIGPQLAEAIVSDREANGPFAGIQDLARVKGISDVLVNKLQSRITASVDQAIVVRPGTTVTSAQVRAALKPYAAEPSIREVQAAAVAYARAHPDRIDSWRVRAANRAFAPTFEAGVVKDWDKTNRKFMEPGVADRSAEYNYDNWRLALRARWNLDRAVLTARRPGSTAKRSAYSVTVTTFSTRSPAVILSAAGCRSRSTWPRPPRWATGCAKSCACKS